MNAPAPIAERIAPLAPRLGPLLGKLGSPHDGEVVSAARAIGRQLDRHGLGWNDLGAALGAGPVVHVIYQEPDPDPAEDWRGMAEFCAGRSLLLSAKEATFIETMVRVLRRPGTEPTEKQARWLRAIFDRLVEEVS
jgi:hypothetical protein